MLKVKAFSRAIYYAKEAISVAENLPESNENQNLNIALYSSLGVIYKESGNFKEGLKWLVKSIQEGKKLISNYREACPLILNTYVPLIETLEELKNYDQSKIYKAEMIEWDNYCNFPN